MFILYDALPQDPIALASSGGPSTAAPLQRQGTGQALIVEVEYEEEAEEEAKGKKRRSVMGGE